MDRRRRLGRRRSAAARRNPEGETKDVRFVEGRRRPPVIRTHPGSVPTVKQHLAAIRMLGDWLVVNQVLPVNPAAAVRGPKHVVTKGATPVLSPAEARKLLESIGTGALAGLRDRALLAVMLYSFARVSAVLGMRRQDYFGQGSRGWLRLHEKGGKRHDVPAHHRAAAALDAYVAAAALEEPKAALFQSVDPAGRRLTGRALERRVGADDGQAARGGRGAAVLDVLPHVPGDGYHAAYLSNGGTRPADRGTRVAEDDEALRPDGGYGDGRRDRAHRDLNGVAAKMRAGSRTLWPPNSAGWGGRVSYYRKRSFATHADRLRPRLEDRRLPVVWTRSATHCRRPALTRSTSTTTSPPAYATRGWTVRLPWHGGHSRRPRGGAELRKPAGRATDWVVDGLRPAASGDDLQSEGRDASRNRTAPSRWTCTRDALRAAGVDASTSTTTSPLASATTGRDSTDACEPCGRTTCSWSGSSTASAATWPIWSTPCRTCRPAGWACGCSPARGRRSTPRPRPAAS